jgi:hypothetical protein
VTDTQDGDSIVGECEENAVCQTAAHTEKQLPQSLRKHIRFRRQRAPLGILPQRSDGFIYFLKPSLRLFRGAILSPPVKRSLNIVFGRLGYRQPRHLRTRCDAVPFTKLATKLLEVLDLSRIHGRNAFLDGEAFAVLPVQGIKPSADNIDFADATADALLYSFDYLVR